MKLFDILKLELPTLNPEECKIHLAVWNGYVNPLDVFLEGKFPEWQNWQTNKNFERPYIVSLIKMDGWCRWLFAGVLGKVEGVFGVWTRGRQKPEKYPAKRRG